MIRRPPRSTQSRSSAASDVYKRQPVSVLNARWDEDHVTGRHRVPPALDHNLPRSLDHEVLVLERMAVVRGPAARGDLYHAQDVHGGAVVLGVNQKADRNAGCLVSELIGRHVGKVRYLRGRLFPTHGYQPRPRA